MFARWCFTLAASLCLLAATNSQLVVNNKQESGFLDFAGQVQTFQSLYDDSMMTRLIKAVEFQGNLNVAKFNISLSTFDDLSIQYRKIHGKWKTHTVTTEEKTAGEVVLSDVVEKTFYVFRACTSSVCGSSETFLVEPMFSLTSSADGAFSRTELAPLASTFTMETWMRPNAVFQVGIFGIQTAVPYVLATFYPSGSIRIHHKGGHKDCGLPVDFDETIPHHFVYTVDVGDAKLFLDGALFCTDTGSTAVDGPNTYYFVPGYSATDDATDSNTLTKIGTEHYTFRVYNRVVSSSEALTFFNRAIDYDETADIEFLFLFGEVSGRVGSSASELYINNREIAKTSTWTRL